MYERDSTPNEGNLEFTERDPILTDPECPPLQQLPFSNEPNLALAFQRPSHPQAVTSMTAIVVWMLACGATVLMWIVAAHVEQVVILKACMALTVIALLLTLHLCTWSPTRTRLARACEMWCNLRRTIQPAWIRLWQSGAVHLASVYMGTALVALLVIHMSIGL
jgi:hypothetical protein